jgi:HK97 gp10 family phage protein
MQIEVDSKELERAFAKAPAVTRDKISSWIRKTALKVERHAKTREVPVDKGQLQSSIRVDYSLGGLSAEISPNKEYAPYVHEGTGIYAKSGMGRKTPWFVKTDDGGFITRGQKPNPFMDRTYEAIKPEAEAAASRILTEIIEAL